MASIVFDADPLATAYNLQRKGVKNFDIGQTEWHDLFKDSNSQAAEKIRERLKSELSEECETAKGLLPIAEKE
jgi:hypothetical protein